MTPVELVEPPREQDIGCRLRSECPHHGTDPAGNDTVIGIMEVHGAASAHLKAYGAGRVCPLADGQANQGWAQIGQRWQRHRRVRGIIDDDELYPVAIAADVAIDVMKQAIESGLPVANRDHNAEDDGWLFAPIAATMERPPCLRQEPAARRSGAGVTISVSGQTPRVS